MGICIIYSDSYKLPSPEVFSSEEIRKDLIFNKNKIKYQYSNSNFSPETIVKAIRDGNIKLRDAEVRQVNAYAYEQIESGSLI